MRIGIAITRAASIDTTWTTVHLAVAALELGWSVRFIEPWDFEVAADRRLIARAHAFEPDRGVTVEAMAAALSGRRATRRFVDVARLDVLLLRAAPLRPTVISLAMMAQAYGVRVVNDPAGLLRVSHKAWLASQPSAHIPPSLVTRSRAAAQLFYESQGDGVVVKPARGSGGRAVHKVAAGSPEDMDEAFDGATLVGDGYVVIQRYLTEADDGEKRLLWLDGELIGGYLRQRAEGEFRHNLKRGGIAVPTEVTAADKRAARSITPALRQAGIRFAGLDVIGGYLIEVNALNPGGTYHTDRLSGTRLSRTVLARLVEPVARPEYRE
ncbi:MAG: glutathione synthase [Myxococcota bacterium]|jgi:glutathione synthase